MAGGIVLLGWIGGLIFDELVRRKLEQVATKAAGVDHRVSIGALRSNLWSGSVELKDLRMEHDSLADDADLTTGLIAIHAERLGLTGVSYRALLFGGRIHVARVEMHAPRVAHVHHSGAPRPVVEPDTATNALAGLPPSIRLDSLIIRDASARTSDLGGKKFSADVGTLDLWAGGLALHNLPGRGAQFVVNSARISIRETTAAFPPLYDLRIGEMWLEHPAGRANVKDLSFLPRTDQHNYHKLLDHETDLFMVEVDSIALGGLHVGRFLAEHALWMRRMDIHRPEVEVYRDKTMPDAPWKHKPLPTGILRNITLPMRIDTAIFHHGKVTYHERVEQEHEYGSLEFTALHGDITGIASGAPSGRRLELRAHARIYGRSKAFLSYGADLDKPGDAFSLSAHTTDLPFDIFNQMTDSLLRVEATAGTIHRLELQMTGDDHRGHGTLHLAYDDLRLAIHITGGKGRDKLLGLLANTAVRSRNVPDLKGYRQGSFAIDRRRDRSLFNFLWQAVKAGSIDTMAPGILRKKASEAGKGPAKADRLGQDKIRRYGRSASLESVGGALAIILPSA